MKTLKHRRRGAAAGFSLAELMVVIVIIGLLATLVVPSVMSKFFTAQGTKAKADITTIASAVNEYALNNNGRYPDSLESLVIEDANGNKMLDRNTVPKDPWNNEYIYEPNNGRDFTIISYGADGQPGGEGQDKDLDYQEIKDGG